jgi:hypothetical protein
MITWRTRVHKLRDTALAPRYQTNRANLERAGALMTTPGPRSGHDTYDLIEDALAKLAERCGAWLGADLAAITLLASG